MKHGLKSFCQALCSRLNRAVWAHVPCAAPPCQAWLEVQVVLKFEVLSEPSGSSWGFLTATAPPDATIAPPGTYMVFILYQGVPAEAEWLQVRTLFFPHMLLLACWNFQKPQFYDSVLEPSGQSFVNSVVAHTHAVLHVLGVRLEACSGDVWRRQQRSRYLEATSPVRIDQLCQLVLQLLLRLIGFSVLWRCSHGSTVLSAHDSRTWPSWAHTVLSCYQALREYGWCTHRLMNTPGLVCRFSQLPQPHRGRWPMAPTTCKA